MIAIILWDKIKGFCGRRCVSENMSRRRAVCPNPATDYRAIGSCYIFVQAPPFCFSSFFSPLLSRLDVCVKRCLLDRNRIHRYLLVELRSIVHNYTYHQLMMAFFLHPRART